MAGTVPSHLASAACSSSSFFASCILSSAIWACSSAIWSLRSVESPSSFLRVFSSSCRCFSSRRRRSGEGRDRLAECAGQTGPDTPDHGAYTRACQIWGWAGAYPGQDPELAQQHSWPRGSPRPAPFSLVS